MSTTTRTIRMAGFISACAIFAGIGPLQSAQDAKNSASAVYAQAMDEPDRAGRLALLQRVVQIDPEHAEAYLQLGLVRKSLKQYGAAESALINAAALGRERLKSGMQYELFFELASVYLRQGNHSGAIEALEEAEPVAPGQAARADVAFQTGRCYAGLGREQLAVAKFEEAARLDPARAAFFEAFASGLGSVEQAPATSGAAETGESADEAASQRERRPVERQQKEPAPEPARELRRTPETAEPVNTRPAGPPTAAKTPAIEEVIPEPRAQPAEPGQMDHREAVDAQTAPLPPAQGPSTRLRSGHAAFRDALESRDWSRAIELLDRMKRNGMSEPESESILAGLRAESGRPIRLDRAGETGSWSETDADFTDNADRADSAPPHSVPEPEDPVPAVVDSLYAASKAHLEAGDWLNATFTLEKLTMIAPGNGDYRELLLLARHELFAAPTHSRTASEAESAKSYWPWLVLGAVGAGVGVSLLARFLQPAKSGRS